LAAFGPAALNDGLSGAARHALHEAMHALAAAFLWLVGLFRHAFTLLKLRPRRSFLTYLFVPIRGVIVKHKHKPSI
jgi:hypothetical protein